MSRHDAYDRLKDTLGAQLAAAREARERAELQQVVAVLIVLAVVGAACLVGVLLS